MIKSLFVLFLMFLIYCSDYRIEYKYIMFISLVILYILSCRYDISEHFDAPTLSNEALQNIASVYNTDNMTVTNLNATGTIALNGTELKLAALNDSNHVLKYSADVDGPALIGFAGGKIGTINNPNVTKWDNLSLTLNGDNTWGGILKLKAGSKEGGYIDFLDQTGNRTGYLMGRSNDIYVGNTGLEVQKHLTIHEGPIYFSNGWAIDTSSDGNFRLVKDGVAKATVTQTGDLHVAGNIFLEAELFFRRASGEYNKIWSWNDEIWAQRTRDGHRNRLL